MLGDRAVVFTTAPITLADGSEPQPDICIAIPPESRYDARHPEPEDTYWVMEVSNSTLAYGLGEKIGLYARKGIQEYWVIDISAKQLWVYRDLDKGICQSRIHLSAGRLIPFALPGIGIEIERLLK